MNPPAAFPRQNDAVAGRPNQLIFCDNLVKDTAAARVRVPNLLAFAGCGVRDANGPGLAFAVRAKGKPALRHGDAHESNSAAVWRPRGLHVSVHAWLEINQRFHRYVVDADEA